MAAGCNIKRPGRGLARGIGMGFYPTVRDTIASASGTPESSGSVMFSAGLLSGAVGYITSTPLWQIKTRVQAGVELKQDRAVRNDWQAMRGMFTAQRGKLSAAYKGAGVLAVRGAMMNAGNTVGYDMTKTLNRKYKMFDDGPLLHLLGSINAAFLSCTLSCPADFVFTRYQAASQMGLVYKNVFDCMRAQMREHGMAVFYTGWLLCLPASLLSTVFT